MSKLLFNEQPLVISPSLATLIGLNESIVIQQIHYWLRTSKHVHNGRKWVYNTYKKWQEQFPFWSEVTVRRIFTSMENKGLIVSGNYNDMKADNTKWYSINYEKLEHMIRPCDQLDQANRSNRSHSPDQYDQTNTRDYTEITTEKKEEEEEEGDHLISNPFLFYQKNIHPIMKPTIIDDFNYFLDNDFFDETNAILTEAMTIACRQDKGWSYAYKALTDWRERGLRTLEAVRAYVKGREKTNDGKNAPVRNGQRQVRVDQLPAGVQWQQQHGNTQTNGLKFNDWLAQKRAEGDLTEYTVSDFVASMRRGD